MEYTMVFWGKAEKANRKHPKKPEKNKSFPHEGKIDLKVPEWVKKKYKNLYRN